MYSGKKESYKKHNKKKRHSLKIDTIFRWHCQCFYYSPLFYFCMFFFYATAEDTFTLQVKWLAEPRHKFRKRNEIIIIQVSNVPKKEKVKCKYYYVLHNCYTIGQTSHKLRAQRTSKFKSIRSTIYFYIYSWTDSTLLHLEMETHHHRTNNKHQPTLKRSIGMAQKALSHTLSFSLPQYIPSHWNGIVCRISISLLIEV